MTQSKRLRQNRARVCSWFSVIACVLVIVGGFFRSVILLTAFSGVATLVLCALTVFAIAATNLRTVFVCVAAMAIAFSVWTTDWPLRLSFNFSKPAFDTMVSEYVTGNRLPEPRITGTMNVKAVEKHGDDLCFWTTHGFDRCGFVKRLGERFDHGKLRIEIPLGDSWYFIVDD